MTTIYSGFSYDPKTKELFFMMTHGSKMIIGAEIRKFASSHNNAYLYINTGGYQLQEGASSKECFLELLKQVTNYLLENDYKVEKFTWKSDSNLNNKGANFPDFLELENFMESAKPLLSKASGEINLFSGDDSVVIESERKYGRNLPEDAPVKVKLTNKAGKPVEELKKEARNQAATHYVADLMRNFFRGTRGNKVEPETALDQKIAPSNRQKPSR